MDGISEPWFQWLFSFLLFILFLFFSKFTSKSSGIVMRIVQSYHVATLHLAVAAVAVSLNEHTFLKFLYSRLFPNLTGGQMPYTSDLSLLGTPPPPIYTHIQHSTAADFKHHLCTALAPQNLTVIFNMLKLVTFCFH